jgi:Flp pilus assembly protein TadG
MLLPPARSRRRAASAVEFAVVIPVFFLFVFGLIELGRGLMAQHLVTNAARQACRVGVIEGKTYGDVQGAAITYLAAQGISGEGVTIQVNDVTDTSANFAPNAGDEITVLVSVPTSSVSWVPGANYLLGGTITGKYTLRRE